MMDIKKRNNRGYLDTDNRDWGYRGDKGTWAHYDEGTNALTISRAKNGIISDGYTNEIAEFAARHGVDFDAIRPGDKIKIIDVHDATDSASGDTGHASTGAACAQAAAEACEEADASDFNVQDDIIDSTGFNGQLSAELEYAIHQALSGSDIPGITVIDDASEPRHKAGRVLCAILDILTSDAGVIRIGYYNDGGSTAIDDLTGDGVDSVSDWADLWDTDGILPTYLAAQLCA